MGRHAAPRRRGAPAVGLALAALVAAGVGLGQSGRLGLSAQPLSTSTSSASQSGSPTTASSAPVPSRTAQPSLSASGSSSSPTASPRPSRTSAQERCPGSGTRAKACAQLGMASSIWVVVNKRNPLDPLRYTPEPLVVPKVAVHNGQVMRSDAAAAMAEMVRAAADEGAGGIGIRSGYRSFATQQDSFNAGVAKTSPTEALKWYAKPGYSEHQTGLTADLIPVGNPACSAHQCIGETAQGRWLFANSWRFGFILRYESGMTSVTGYNYEPWHYRYVGREIAAEYHKGAYRTLEQFFGLPTAPTY